ncbi:MAG: polysaccharide biosynthesis/export family protein, partial [Brevundimonas sp.]
MGLAAGLASCASGGAPGASADTPDLAFAPWSDIAPEYLLFPGDEIEVALPTANELTRQLKIGPDGRVSLPLLGHVMA